MKEVSNHEFCKTIADDFNIELTHKIKMFKKHFPIKKGKIKISSSYDSIIVDNEGNEHPYMLTDNIRNNEKLVDFDYIYVVRYKTLSTILTEAKIEIKSQPCRICEGGGWYSNGTKYFYKDIYCEI